MESLLRASARALGFEICLDIVAKDYPSTPMQAAFFAAVGSVIQVIQVHPLPNGAAIEGLNRSQGSLPIYWPQGDSDFAATLMRLILPTVAARSVVPSPSTLCLPLRSMVSRKALSAMALRSTKSSAPPGINEPDWYTQTTCRVSPTHAASRHSMAQTVAAAFCRPFFTQRESLLEIGTALQNPQTPQTPQTPLDAALFRLANETEIAQTPQTPQFQKKVRTRRAPPNC